MPISKWTIETNKKSCSHSYVHDLLRCILFAFSLNKYVTGEYRVLYLEKSLSECYRDRTVDCNFVDPKSLGSSAFSLLTVNLSKKQIVPWTLWFRDGRLKLPLKWDTLNGSNQGKSNNKTNLSNFHPSI